MFTSPLDYLRQTLAAHRDKIVYSDGERSLTFAQVADLALAAASFLVGHTKPRTGVVVMSGRHVLTPVAFLGTAMAGCFYIPMDASLPVSRLNSILSVARPEHMIADRANLEAARALDFHGQIYVLEELLETPRRPDAVRRATEHLNEDIPLYTIFTSGSSGTPKGVVTSHRALMNYIDAVAKVLRLTEEDVLGNQSPLDYIAAVRDIYLPLKTGASTVILPKNQFAMPVDLFRTLNEEKVTVLCWSVSGLELPARLRAFDYARPEHLKTVLFSGSVMPCKYLRVWQDALPGVRFINQYGPTETTASCTYYEVEGPVEETDVLPIGVPYDNYSVFLLSPEGKAVPDGELGEICVSGPGLALGYYGDPERTALSFMQNPLNDRYLERIYRTGDIGRVREDGLLEFHGRNDRQIKHQGHRVELGEIEVTAMSLPGVAECCAIYKNEKISLVYAGEAKEKEIQLAFRERLPLFMMPRKVVRVDALPRLPNGKTDMQTINSLL